MRARELFEQAAIRYETLNGDDLWALLDQDANGDLLDQPKRIKYLTASEIKRETHIVAFDGDKIVGIGGVEVSPYHPEQLWIKHISVDPAYQGRGIARELLTRIYRYAQETGTKLQPGSFTDEGQRLAHIHAELDKTFPNAALVTARR